MKRKKILFSFGTRPEAIKMAPVIHQLTTHNSQLTTRVCVTAQHRHMLDEVLKVFKIRPDYDLNVMEEGQSLEHITRHVIDRISPVLKKEKPDLVLVHGDTSTTFLTALAAFYQRIPIGHVEAGLRSYDFGHPFPEEGNRRLCDAICTLYFAPTQTAKKNLLKENIPAKNIFVTGNTVIDALQWAISKPHNFHNEQLRSFFNSQLIPHQLSKSEVKAQMPLKFLAGHIESWWGINFPLILVTAHRRENFGQPLENICLALRTIADSFPNVQIIYPVHLNPNVQSVAKKVLAKHSRILLIPPLDYLDFSHLIKRCTFVVTDSGGLQEESPALGKPVLVLREVTERPEAVQSGTVRVIGTERERIVREISKLLKDSRHYKRMATALNPYGDGKAAQRIADSISCYFEHTKKPKDFYPR